MKVEGASGYSMKFYQSVFSKGPEGFDSIDMAFASGKFISTMMYSIVLLITQIHQAIVTSPLIRMDNAFRGDSTSYYRLQRCFGAIRNYLGIYFSLSLKNAKNWRFASSPTAAFTSNSFGTEVGFINFDFALKRCFGFAKFSYSFANQF